MIKCLLIIPLLTIVICKTPPIQIGNTNQYILVKVNSDFNITCPFKNAHFFKWRHLKTRTPPLSDQQYLKVKITSDTKCEIYECDAINGYGKRNAIFIIKGIDTRSKQFDFDCQSRETGPCFLVSGRERNDFEFIMEENSKIALDCRAIMNSTNKSSLTYTWRKVLLNEPLDMKQGIYQSNVAAKNTGQFMDEVPPIGKVEYNNIDDMAKWGAIVTLKNITKEADGLYQCMVSSNLNTIKRTFRLRVKEISSISTIEGPLNQTIKTGIGSTQTLSCKAYTKPKWGKKLDINDESSESEEIIKWGGSRYKMLQGTLDLEHIANGGSVKDSKYYVNNLILENIQPSQSGIYVCTVLTSSTLEHKYVNLFIESVTGYDNTKKSNNFPIYIAVPTTVFIICLATIIYCIVHRRIRRKANFKNRTTRGQTATTTNSSSGNGSNSGSRNTSNPRHHMLTTTTSSSKASQNQFTPENNISSGYGPNMPPFSTGYTPATMNYSYAGPNPYIRLTNNTPCSTDNDHQCSHLNALLHTTNCHPIPYDSDTTPSPPPPTSVITDNASSTLQSVNVTNPNILVPFSVHGDFSVNSYSPNQSSQIYIANQTPHGSSSTSASSPNVIYPTCQPQQVYPIGVMYSA